jgi:hypothetical protein
MLIDDKKDDTTFMTQSTQKIDFATAQACLTTEGIIAHASEIHGALTGLVSAGLTYEDNSYLTLITDMFNNGEPLSHSVQALITNLFDQLWQNIVDDNYGFTLLLPDDDDSLAERSNGLCLWVQGFTLGFGLQQKNTQTLPDEIKEILQDFVEIANLSSDIEEDDEDSEQAFYEIVEYVRLSALLCFSELGVAPEKPANKANLH